MRAEVESYLKACGTVEKKDDERYVVMYGENPYGAEHPGDFAVVAIIPESEAERMAAVAGMRAGALEACVEKWEENAAKSVAYETTASVHVVSADDDLDAREKIVEATGKEFLVDGNMGRLSGVVTTREAARKLDELFGNHGSDIMPECHVVLGNSGKCVEIGVTLVGTTSMGDELEQRVAMELETHQLEELLHAPENAQAPKA